MHKRHLLVLLLAIGLALLAGCAPAASGGDETLEPTEAADTMESVDPTTAPTEAPAILPTGEVPPTEDALGAAGGAAGSSLALPDFAQSVRDAVTAKDVEFMSALMHDPHTIAFWRSEGMALPAAEAAADLANHRIANGNTVAFSEPPANLSELMDGMDPMQLFGPDVQVVELLYSTGWGVDGGDEALLYITMQADGSFIWYGTLIAHGGFAMTADTLNTLEEVQQAVQDALTARNPDLMAQSMTEPFLTAYWQSEGVMVTRFEAANTVLNFAPAGSTIELFQDVPPELESMLAGDMETLWGPEANPVDTMYSTGWGDGGNGEAILVFSRSPEGLYSWYGILLAAGGF